jgi:hypothetical protein
VVFVVVVVEEEEVVVVVVRRSRSIKCKPVFVAIVGLESMPATCR